MSRFAKQRRLKWYLFAMILSDISWIKYTNKAKTQTEGSPLTVASRLRILSSTVDPKLGNTLWKMCVGICAYTRCPRMNRFKTEYSDRLTSDHTMNVQSSRACSEIFYILEWFFKLKFDIIMSTGFHFVKT